MVKVTLSLLLLLIGATSAMAASECFTVASCSNALSNPYTAGGFNACVIDTNGRICSVQTGGQTPTGSTQITGVFSGADTSSQAATLTGTAGKTTYICGFTVNGLGATSATPVSVAVATLAPGSTLTYSYVFPAGAAVASTPLSITYNPCLPASAAAANITVTVPGAAGNTATQINAWGYLF